MLHYFHQLVADCGCLFGADQVMYSWFLKRFLFMWMRAVRVNQNRKAAERKNQNTELKDA